MKTHHQILIWIALISFIACSGNSSKAKINPYASEQSETPAPITPTANAIETPTPDPNNPIVNAVNAGRTDHYVCPNKCEGGESMTAGNCPVCGTELEHNADFHNQDASNNSPVANTTPIPPEITPTTQSNNGVFHYTCPNGCEGGSTASGPCPNCGAQLVHNTAFHNQTPTGAPNAGSPVASNSASNAAGVYHYTCPNGCEGGSSASGPCPNCGAQLAHNTAFHNQPSAPSAGAPVAGSPIASSPAKNAAGVYHYSCPTGCDGGAGSSGLCVKCGAQLVHNTAYHQ